MVSFSWVELQVIEGNINLWLYSVLCAFFPLLACHQYPTHNQDCESPTNYEMISYSFVYLQVT